jgi:Transcription factor WhiB
MVSHAEWYAANRAESHTIADAVNPPVRYAEMLVRDRLASVVQRTDAACRGRADWLSAPAPHLYYEWLDERRSTCATCPAQDWCAELADIVHPTVGVWAGSDHEPRPRLRPVGRPRHADHPLAGLTHPIDSKDAA